MQHRLDEFYGVLDVGEREKADRFRRPVDRQMSLIARGALRTLLSEYSGIPANRIEFSYSENGKPFWAAPASDTAVAFNVSHSGDQILLAFGGGAVGVDIERIRARKSIHAVAARYYTPKEIERIETATDPTALFFKIWTRKEAYVKACGSTLFSELNQITVPLEEGTEANGCFFYSPEVGPDYAAALAVCRPVRNMVYHRFDEMPAPNEIS